MIADRQPLRVVINAQFVPGQGFGGVESVIIGLVAALGQLADGREEYIIVGPHDGSEWLKAYLGPNQRLVPGPQPFRKRPRFYRLLRPAVHKFRSFVRGFLQFQQPPPQLEMSNGFFEGLGGSVIHFPSQFFVVCSCPTVYNPHDLQHLHFPEYFPPETIVRRETIYQAGCHYSHTIAVASAYVKSDIIRHYRVSPDKIQVIPWAPPTCAYPGPSPEQLQELQGQWDLRTPFMLYPAVTWPHKNHHRLLDAITQLRDHHGLTIRLVCTGSANDFLLEVQRRVAELNLQDQVRFLGHVPGSELRALYRLAQFVVIPTLFEASSCPLSEAWLEGTPAACSAVTSLPDQARGAALLFDPFSVEAIADAVRKLATDPGLRESLRQRGLRRLQCFDWRLTAKAYRAVYRQAARRPLSDEDRWLLAHDWTQTDDPVKTDAALSELIR